MRKLKHEELAETIRQMIIGGEYKPGDVLPSQNEMARQYEMNHTTVRESIAALVNEGLVVRINGKGTFVSECKRPRHITIGLATYFLTEIGDEERSSRVSNFNTRVIHGVNLEAQKNDAGVLFALNLPDPEVERKNIYSFIDRRLDAVIMQLFFKDHNVDALRDLKKAGIPLILVDRYAEFYETDYVISDNFEATRLAMDYMLDRGFANNLYFRYEEQTTVLREREAGFISSLYHHGLNPDGKVITLKNPLSKGWCESWIASAREALTSLPHPIGIFACSSYAFEELWPIIEELGLPHDQIALLAFDEPVPGCIPDDVLFVNVIQQMEEMGQAAVRIAIEKINGLQEPRQIRLSTTMRVLHDNKVNSKPLVLK